MGRCLKNVRQRFEIFYFNVFPTLFVIDLVPLVDVVVVVIVERIGLVVLQWIVSVAVGGIGAETAEAFPADGFDDVLVRLRFVRLVVFYADVEK